MRIYFLERMMLAGLGLHYRVRYPPVAHPMTNGSSCCPALGPFLSVIPKWILPATLGI